MVRISALIDHPDFRSRPAQHRGDLKPLRTAFEEGVDIAPILVAVIDTGWGQSKAFILDGRRRIAAARAAGQEHIRAHILEPISWQAARFEAQAANLANSLALKPRVLKKAAREALKAYIASKKHLRYQLDPFSGEGAYVAQGLREIASDLKGVVSHETVRSWIKKDNPRLYARWWAGDAPPEIGNEELGKPQDQLPSNQEMIFEEALEGVRACLLASPQEDRLRMVKDALSRLEGLVKEDPSEAVGRGHLEPPEPDF